ncbi:MAG: NAD-dependent epimerase/dehydratase family protein [Halioglobus sp.]
MHQPNFNRIAAADIKEVLARDIPWQEFSGTTIVITGASGFLGGYLLRTLLGLYSVGLVDKPVLVIGLVRDVPRARKLLAEVVNDSHLRLVQWDLNQIAVPPLGDCNYVLHAASLASPKYYGNDPVGTLLPNSVGTASLLSAFQQSKDPRGFLFVSSSEVYGSVSSDEPIQEDVFGSLNPAAIRSCYSESKRMGEALCVAWQGQFDMPTFIVRPFHTYGPGLRPDDGRVFSDFSYNIVRGEDIVMMSDGQARRAFCYVTDAIAGFYTVLLKGRPATPYNVANPAGELSVFELAELLINLYPEKKLEIVRKVPVDNHSYLASTFSRLVPDVKRLVELGWKADISPSKGFRRMIEAHSP